MESLRILKHLLNTHRTVKRAFPQVALVAIERAISEAETSHTGEISFAIEAGLHPGQVIDGMTSRERALDVFSQLRVWDTEDNNGVLIYVLLADRAVEVVADRGIHARLGNDEVWQSVVDSMQEAFAAGHFETGAVHGIATVARELAKHFPVKGANLNELPNNVTLL